MKYIIALLLIGGISSPSFAWPRRTFGAHIVSQNAGDRAEGVSITVGTTTPVLVYTSTAKHREVLLINQSTSYFLYIGTHSAVSASSGPRAVIPKATTERPGSFLTNATANIYAIYESSAGGALLEVLGWIEFDKGD